MSKTEITVGWAKELPYMAGGWDWLAGGYVVSETLATKINKAKMNTTLRGVVLNEKNGKKFSATIYIGPRFE